MKKILYLLLIHCVLQAEAQNIRYVKPVAAGSGDGSSWANASASIQDMLNVASVEEVWVAKGTYKPSTYPTGCTTCSSSRDYAFFLPANTKLIGGFGGTETTIAQRDITLNETILDGDIGVIGVETDNVYHVLLSAFSFGETMSVEVDGFTIKGGYGKNASGSVSVNSVSISRVSGSGALFYYGNKTVKNCLFTNNKGSGVGGAVYAMNNSTTTATFENSQFLSNEAANGGGVYVFSGTGNFTNCDFNGNSATSNSGALGTNFTYATNINNCTFLQNTAVMNGGAILFDISNGHISNSTFESNTASNHGGAIYNERTDLLLETSHFKSNSSKQGGAIELFYDDAIIRKNFFESNSTTQYTGGAIHTSSSESEINQNVFYDNYGFVGGGALGLGGDVQLHSNLFYANNAKYWGGAIFFFSGSTFRTIKNNTFVKNSSTSSGGAVYTHSGDTHFYQNIFWQNGINGNVAHANADYYNYQGVNLFKNNALQMTSSGYVVSNTGVRHIGAGAAGNTFATAPLFKDDSDPEGSDNLFRNSDDGFQLLGTSPFKNASSINPPIEDITGASRDDQPDWGAYEFGASNCPETLAVTGPINTDQKANLSISTGLPNTINTASSVTYQAGNYIQLNPGFSTGVNAVFVTRLLGGCQ